MRNTKFPSTTTDSKLLTIKNENILILENKCIGYTDARIGGVVGLSDGLDRHIEQWKELGFKEEKIHIFEIHKGMYIDLKKAIQEKNYKVNLHFCDILNPDILTQKQLNEFVHLDVDITTSLNINTFIPTIEKMFTVYPSLSSFVFVHSARSSKTRLANTEIDLQKYKDLFECIKNQNLTPKTASNYIAGFRSVYDYYKNHNNNGKSIFLKELNERFINYCVKIQKYVGAKQQVMYSFTFVESEQPKHDFIDFNTTPSDFNKKMFKQLKNKLNTCSNSRRAIDKELFIKYDPLLTKMCKDINAL
jgi:hypothetical protein